MEGRAHGGLQACERPSAKHAAKSGRSELYDSSWPGLSGVIVFCVAVLLLSAVFIGQACQQSYSSGHAAGMAEGILQEQQQAYDRGYASAVYDYQEGTALWAR